MRKLIITFPDNEKMIQYILRENISGAEVNSKEQALTAVLGDKDIITACREYQGYLNRGNPFY